MRHTESAGHCGSLIAKQASRFAGARFTCVFLTLLAAMVLSRAAGAQPPANWTRSTTIEINAPDHKPDGKPWDLDVPVMFGPVMPNLGDPAPDMMVCIVDVSGRNHCIHDTKVNRFGVPLSICPNVFRCSFNDVKIPPSGSFGLLVVDLDIYPSKQDYMLATIMHIGNADKSDNFKLEKALKALITKWNVVGAPDEFADARMESCTIDDPCFGSAKAGVPSASFSETVIGSCADIGMKIRGSLAFEAGETAHRVDFRFRASENECPGATEYVWQFGDGLTLTTDRPMAQHQYSSSGAFNAGVVVRCKRTRSVCDAPPSTAQIQIAP